MDSYDIILFENYQLATHHQYDVELIARLIKSRRYKVAIFDIYHQYKELKKGDIDIIHWYPKNSLPDCEWMKSPHNKITSIIQGIRYKILLKKYLKEACDYIQNKSDNFYCGSYYIGMPTVLFNIKKNCYWWGLRSNRFSYSLSKFIKSPINTYHIYLQRKKFLKNPYQKLFVSNPMILEEHAHLGIPRDRMIIREERCFEEDCIEERCISDLERSANEISRKTTVFLVIGMLRPDKQIEKSIHAFKIANITDSQLLLIGRSVDTYEQIISATIAEDHRISRKNGYLEYSEFNKAYQSSDFVLFADKEGDCCITNGTFAEALINRKPVICPNYNPYKYYFEKYKIGILYDPNDISTYASALIKASELGKEHFKEGIERYLKSIDFNQVAKDLEASIFYRNDK